VRISCHVRVGVHTGPAVMRDCDWYGSAVNLAALLAAAEPNEALVSSATAARGPWRAGPRDGRAARARAPRHGAADRRLATYITTPGRGLDARSTRSAVSGSL
jgi:class 3 adenylate cyclase